jgi:hypothetical protein
LQSHQWTNWKHGNTGRVLVAQMSSYSLLGRRRVRSDLISAGGFRDYVKNGVRRITLKAFANSSPGLRFGYPGEYVFISRRRNSEGVATAFAGKAVATPSELRKSYFESLEPRVSKPTLGWN